MCTLWNPHLFSFFIKSSQFFRINLLLFLNFSKTESTETLENPSLQFWIIGFHFKGRWLTFLVPVFVFISSADFSLRTLVLPPVPLSLWRPPLLHPACLSFPLAVSPLPETLPTGPQFFLFPPASWFQWTSSPFFRLYRCWFLCCCFAEISVQLQEIKIVCHCLWKAKWHFYHLKETTLISSSTISPLRIAIDKAWLPRWKRHSTLPEKN